MSATTDSTGRFVFRNIPAGTYTAAARRESHWGPASASNIQGQPVAASVLQIGSAGETANVTLFLTPGSIIRGVVRRPDDSPAADVAVAALRMTSRPGIYDVLAVASLKQRPVSGGLQFYTGRATVDIRDRDVQDVRITITEAQR